MDELRKKIASQLTIARKQAGLSQAQLAKLIGIHRPSITEIEAGRRKVSAEELAKYADICGVSVGWIIGESRDSAGTGKDGIALAARELSSLDKKDLDKVIKLLQSMKDE